MTRRLLRPLAASGAALALAIGATACEADDEGISPGVEEPDDTGTDDDDDGGY